MKRVIIILCLCAAVANSADVVLGPLSGLSWSGSGTTRVAYWGAAEPPGDLHWFDPYSTNTIGTVFLLDWPTNTVAGRGTIGTGWDAGATNGAATAGVVTHVPTITNGPTWANLGTNSLGDVNYGWEFDGVNDYMSVDNRGDYSFGDGTNDSPFTIYGWVKPLVSAQQFILAKNSGSTSREWTLGMSTAFSVQLFRYCHLGNATNISNKSANNACPSNQWTFITVTYSGASDPLLYTNGTLASFAATTTGVYTAMSKGTATLRVGGATFFKGSLANLGIIRTNLSPSEVSALFTGYGGSGGPGASVRKRIPIGAYP
jgi:hypothetical protein